MRLGGLGSRPLPAPTKLLEDRIIHCRYCGTDNQVPRNVVGQLCDNCGEAIFSPEVEPALKAPIALADRTGDVLRVTCPHCQNVNEFPGLDLVDAFLCHECGEPVQVKEPIQ
jgi:YgiT-type zinc finger domain-containing protein